jgi:outer membrane protein assembly factor BamB
LYLTSFDRTALRVHAFDIKTGNPLWVGELPRERAAKQNSLNNAASPSPACDNSGVVALFSDFGIAAWNTDGKPRWRHPMPAVINNHGQASSPVLAGGLVVQVLGADAGSEVLVRRWDSGKEVWKDKLSGVTYSTPAITPDGQVIILSTGEMVSFDLPTGNRRWWVMGLPYQPKSSPILSMDGKTVYFSALSVEESSKAQLASYEKLLQQFDVNGDGKISIDEVRERKGPVDGFVQIDLNGDGVFTREEHRDLMRIAESPHIAAAIPTNGTGDQTGKLLWALHKGVPNVSSPIVIGDVLYMVKEGGILSSVRVADGSVVKEGRVATGFGAVYSSPIAVGNLLFIANQQGKVIVLKAEPEWQILAVNDLGEEIFATPAVAGNRMFVRTATTLWCFMEVR